MSEILKTLNSLPPQWAGVLMAIFMSVIRIVYDNKETTPLRIFLEALLCGALSLTVTYGITAMGLNINWAIFAGGAIGYLGPATVRTFIIRVLRKRT